MKKTISETQYICDVCGKKANGDFFMDLNVNGDYENSYYCPLDLCNVCMYNFYRFLGQHESEMMKFLDSRRSDLRCSEANKKILIKELKRMNEEKLMNECKWPLWGAKYL